MADSVHQVVELAAGADPAAAGLRPARARRLPPRHGQQQRQVHPAARHRPHALVGRDRCRRRRRSCADRTHAEDRAALSPDRVELAMHDANAIRPLSDREFRMFQQLIYREAGIISPRPRRRSSTRPAWRAGVRALGLPRFHRVLRARRGGSDVERDGDARLHLHERDALLPRAAAVRISRARRAAAMARAGDGRRIAEADARLERRLLDRRGAVLAGDGAAHALPGEDGCVEICVRSLHARARRPPATASGRSSAAREIPERTCARPTCCAAFAARRASMRAQPALRSLIAFRRINLNDADYRDPRRLRSHLLPQRADLLRSRVESSA